MDKRSSQLRALVTGGGGFIGHHLVRRLLADGYDVRVLDKSPPAEGSASRRLDVSLVEGDLRSYERATPPYVERTWSSISGRCRPCLVRYRIR
jgi:nucleoside-diphosphate-sugar epimerase